MADARAIEHYYPVKYKEAFSPVPGVTVRFIDAGHILGSAAIRLDMEENGEKKSLWFSGDIGRYGLPLITDPVMPIGCGLPDDGMHLRRYGTLDR